LMSTNPVPPHGRLQAANIMIGARDSGIPSRQSCLHPNRASVTLSRLTCFVITAA
jgi:hypothetical protein